MSSTRYKHALHLAIDANFKLKLKNKKDQQKHYSPGWGYFVEEKEYQEHLKGRMDEPDVRSFFLLTELKLIVAAL